MPANGKLRVLVVDDEPAARFGIDDYLQTHGFDVGEAVDCRSALESFCQRQPDAVILDYLLPDGDALQLMSRLHAMEASVPILILTAHGNVELAARAIKEGAVQFLTKPIELAALLALLHREIDRSHPRGGTSSPGLA